MRVATIIAMMVLGGAGLFGGTSFIVDPSGSTLGLDRAVLPPWYEGDFLPAGVVLVAFFGLAPLLAAALLVWAPRRGWPVTLCVGTMLLLWMLGQVAVIGLILPPMQLGFATLGVVLAVVGAVHSARSIKEPASKSQRSAYPRSR